MKWSHRKWNVRWLNRVSEQSVWFNKCTMRYYNRNVCLKIYDSVYWTKSFVFTIFRWIVRSLLFSFTLLMPLLFIWVGCVYCFLGIPNFSSRFFVLFCFVLCSLSLSLSLAKKPKSVVAHFKMIASAYIMNESTACYLCVLRRMNHLNLWFGIEAVVFINFSLIRFANVWMIHHACFCFLYGTEFIVKNPKIWRYHWMNGNS